MFVNTDIPTSLTIVYHYDMGSSLITPLTDFQSLERSMSGSHFNSLAFSSFPYVQYYNET